MDERSPGYYAVLPAPVRYDDSIPANAKLLYGEISALIGSEGYCFASNSYFASLYKLSERTISGLISTLHDAKYIIVQVERDRAGKVTNRKIYLTASAVEGHPVEKIFYTPGKSFREGIEKNFQYTNLSNTDIDKENKKESPPKKKRTSPTDFDPLPLFVGWIDQTFCGFYPHTKNALYQALVRFADNRRAIKKPLKSKAAVTALTNKLLQYAGEDVGCMIDLLDTATSSGWQSVYPPKSAQSRAAPQSSGGRVYEEL